MHDHREHDHDHQHGHDHRHTHGPQHAHDHRDAHGPQHAHDHRHEHRGHGRDAHPLGHNGPAERPLQWQTPHLPHGHAATAEPPAAQDIDLVEAAFVESFARATDATSFLRLAGVPFVGESADGRRLYLLRVETEDMVDVGAVMPLVGGAGVTYHPLPAQLTSHRRRLAFVYHDGSAALRLGFAAARALADRSAAAQFALRSRDADQED